MLSTPVMTVSQKFDSTGAFIMTWGKHRNGQTVNLWPPRAIAVDREGNTFRC